MSSWTANKMKITCTLESLQNVFHEKQMEVDRGVLVLKREKDRLRLLEECSSAPPCDLEEMRRAMMLKRDALEASAEQAAQELLGRRSGDQASWKPCHQKGKEGYKKRKQWTVYELVIA